MMMGDDPAFLSVGTEVSAKYKGAFCEAKIRKVVKSVKCKIHFKQGLGITTVGDEHVKGTLRVGSNVEARHPEKKEYVEGTITKIQDCSQYTVVFDDGDITTLRRTALCLKSGRHFAESETLDQLPLTHPEHFSNPVVGGRRGRRHPRGDSSDEEDVTPRPKKVREEKEADTGRVVCVEGEKKKQKDNWFPALVVAPTAQDTVRIHVKDEYLVRSFKDGRYYTVPKKEITEFTREIGARVDNHTLKAAVEKALLFMDKDELPPHWDRDLLFGLNNSMSMDSDHNIESDSSDDEPREEKDHFVAQLYKFMDDRGTPINQGPTVSSKDVDLYRLFKVVQNLGGYNRVTNYNHWKTVSNKLGFGESSNNINMVKNIYKKFLHSFEEFYRKLGCTMVSHPRTYRGRKAGRSLIRDRDRLSVSSLTRGRPSDESEDSSLHEPSSLSETKVEVKSEPEEEEEGSDNEPTSSSRSRSADLREKPAAKKVVEVKEEPKEEPKPKVEPPKEELKRDKPVRQSKLKAASQAETVKTPPKPPPKTEVTPEKKKGFFKKLAGKKTKEKDKEVPAAAKPSGGLALTRKKRMVKEKVKLIVDKIKNKLVKDNTSTEKVTPPAEPEKPPAAKPKAKEEPATPAVKVKKEEVSPASKPPEEKKKTGRKKKEKNESDEVFDTVPSYKTVCVGDKLKVYYGPTHESKVTYEAKVLSIRTEGSEVTYLVHYTGWNNRYDEYIKHSRIADNLSWVPGRAVKKTNQASSKSVRKKSTTGGKNEAVGKVSSSPGAKQGNAKLTPPPIKRSSSRTSGRKEESVEEKVEECLPEEKDSVAKEIKEGPGRRRRKLSDSESENKEAAENSEDSTSEDIKQPDDRKNDSDAGSGKSSPPAKRSLSIEELSPGKRQSLEKSPAESPVDNSFSRDFDLNQIRSELKGLEKTDSAPPSPAAVQQQSEEPAEEDIYEFKEPEPFEFESRKSDDKNKGQRRPLGARIFEDIGSVSPMKKQPRTILPNLFYKGKKEVDSESKEYTESVYNFDTCEEMFDKSSTSPTRESEECSRSYQLFSDLPEGDEESTSSLASKPVSPSQTDPTLPPDSIMDSFDSNGVESTTKSCFSRDEDDSGDETINYAIQRAIKQDMSDNEDHVDEVATSPSLLKIDSIIYSPEKESSVDKSLGETVTLTVEPPPDIKGEDSSEAPMPQDEEIEEPMEEEELEEEIKTVEEQVVTEQSDVDLPEKEEMEVIEETATVVVVEQPQSIAEETVVEEEKPMEEEDEEPEEDLKMEDDLEDLEERVEEDEEQEEELQEEVPEEMNLIEDKKIKDEDYEEEEEDVTVKDSEVEEELDKHDGNSDSVPLYLKCEETIPGSPQRIKEDTPEEVIEQQPSPHRSPSPNLPPEEPDSDSSTSSSSSTPTPTPTSKPTERFSKQSRYNFLIAFEPDMDANQRISALMNSIQEIRKCYSDLKSELAVIDRRRKKLRKREREALVSGR